MIIYLTRGLLILTSLMFVTTSYAVNHKNGGANLSIRMLSQNNRSFNQQGIYGIVVYEICKNNSAVRYREIRDRNLKSFNLSMPKCKKLEAYYTIVYRFDGQVNYWYTARSRYSVGAVMGLGFELDQNGSVNVKKYLGRGKYEWLKGSHDQRPSVGLKYGKGRFFIQMKNAGAITNASPRIVRMDIEQQCSPTRAGHKVILTEANFSKNSTGSWVQGEFARCKTSAARLRGYHVTLYLGPKNSTPDQWQAQAIVYRFDRISYPLSLSFDSNGVLLQDHGLSGNLAEPRGPFAGAVYTPLTIPSAAAATPGSTVIGGLRAAASTARAALIAKAARLRPVRVPFRNMRASSNAAKQKATVVKLSGQFKRLYGKAQGPKAPGLTKVERLQATRLLKQIINLDKNANSATKAARIKMLGNLRNATPINGSRGSNVGNMIAAKESVSSVMRRALSYQPGTGIFRKGGKKDQTPPKNPVASLSALTRGWYQIMSGIHNYNCLTLPRFARIGQLQVKANTDSCVRSNPKQLWYFQAQGNNMFYIKNKFNQTTNVCLNLDTNMLACGRPTQKWTIIPKGHGIYQFKIAYQNMCLNLRKVRGRILPTNPTRCTSHKDQTWKIVRVG